MSQMEIQLRLMVDSIRDREQRIDRLKTLANRRSVPLFSTDSPCCLNSRPAERHFLSDGCLVCRFEHECDKLRTEYDVQATIIRKYYYFISYSIYVDRAMFIALFLGEIADERSILIKTEAVSALELSDVRMTLAPVDLANIKTEPVDDDANHTVTEFTPSNTFSTMDAYDWALQTYTVQTQVSPEYYDPYGVQSNPFNPRVGPADDSLYDFNAWTYEDLRYFWTM